MTGFRLARLAERNHPALARVDLVGDGLDGAALAGGVAPLEQNNDPLASARDGDVRLIWSLRAEAVTAAA